MLHQEEQTKEGLKRRRHAGKKAHGRPSVLNDELVTTIRQARVDGASMRQIAKNLDVSLGTIQNAINS